MPNNNKRLVKPCPFCGSYNIEFINTTTADHGDSTWSGRVVCIDCDATQDVEGWGRTPKLSDIGLAFKAWNRRVGHE